VAGQAIEVPAAPASSAAPDENDPGDACAAAAEASVHGQVAIEVSELMQGNTVRRDWQRLAALRVPCGSPGGAALEREIATLGRMDRLAGQDGRLAPGRGPPAAAALKHEIETLDRIIAWQVKTADWHLAGAAGSRTRQRG
jgi:hypothetical protein